MFAIVLGLLAWIFLLARVVMYAAEVNVVLAHELWPRSLNPPPLTDADRRAFQLYALRGAAARSSPAGPAPRSLAAGRRASDGVR